jgi:hypothetical protein
MKPEELMAGEDSESEETFSELAGTHFTIKEIKFEMKITEFKRSRIGLIAEFCRIPNGFPNQVEFLDPGCICRKRGCSILRHRDFF